jgi:glycosyltransferase involved in cell wall biosynthesis
MAESEIIELDPFLKALSNPDFKNEIRFITFGSYLRPQIIEKYKLNGIVEERGWIDYLKNVDKLDDVDVYVQIRRDNILSVAGWPNKLGDYLSNGKPILLFPYGDLVSFISDNPDGFITVNYEIESISLKIKEIISGKYDLLKMGIINRGIAEKNSWESKALEIIKFRNNLIYEK